MKNYRNYLFITPENWDKNTPMGETNLKALFDTYKSISGLPEAKPFVDVIEVPRDLKDYLVNRKMVEKGLLICTQQVIQYHEEKSTVVLVTAEEIKTAFSGFKKDLLKLQGDLVAKVNEISKAIVELQKFESMLDKIR
ncbi:MAG: hypothetical protein WC511_02155 [Candidatus Pacearchaeota archaeon]